MVIKRAGLKCIAEFSDPKNVVVAVVVFKGKLVIATTTGVYMYPKEKKDVKHNNPR